MLREKMREVIPTKSGGKHKGLEQNPTRSGEKREHAVKVHAQPNRIVECTCCPLLSARVWRNRFALVLMLNSARLAAKLLLHLAAVCAVYWITPGHNSPGRKNGSKRTIRSCLDEADVPQLLLHLAALSTIVWMTPSHN